MAQTIRFAIFAASAALAGLTFSVLHSFWTWATPLLSFPHGIPADRDTQNPADDGAFDYPDKCKGSIIAEYSTDQFNRDFSSGPWPTQQVNLMRFWCGIDDAAKAARDVQKVSDRKGGPHGTSVIQIPC
ncbi:MAG: hypothetical protein EOS76_06755 [Mesorhizobium sp.]|uniref:hypothetical protein n=1 Tax=unclassified Mesorhizobium TaxID=325217 RepID=UPI000F752027|nr:MULTISPECIES: hypothetical protein [unclassified Mesorhizobium]RVC75909.1 hypothetical protein EN766_15015 [Mesorhizobium sp. M2A.F.Ca.ET.046.02.1.1]AZO34041.1 hypothetical protein EJ072_05625 [Mesorhizobium sp. M2A.F.Ca.ET.046.03.2.1]AZO71464.1 hypothetical protein EJ067_09975 [Mesorhizobium sp. M1D.F.Ca.ET.043.01.1.1]RWB47003.1 MAG: hypothetical protein EOQ44_07425 [Mesorhizobium sp.]RWE20789.1 MAG: hypothetical protein EOS76_06755 [Mesorhizobium sp.]